MKRGEASDSHAPEPKRRNVDLEQDYRRRFASAANAQEVAKTWEEAAEHINLNEIHLTTALKACTKNAKVAMQIMVSAQAAGIKPNVFHFTCLLRISGTPTTKILARMAKR